MHNFASGMGHNYSVHHEYHKLPSAVTQITQNNKILIHANNNKGEKIIGKRLRDIEVDFDDILESNRDVENDSEDSSVDENEDRERQRELLKNTKAPEINYERKNLRRPSRVSIQGN